MNNSIEQYAKELGEKARKASRALRQLPVAKRNAVLKKLISKINSANVEILKENAKDIEAGKKAGLPAPMLDRLLLNEKRLAGIISSLKDIIAIKDPLGKTLGKHTRKDGLKIARVSVPIGTVFFIFEARPNVTVDGGALCLKSGNAVILRGGKEAAYSNAIFAKLFTEALQSEKVTADAVQLVNVVDRQLVDYLLSDTKHIDLVIPRGGESLIRAVVEKSRIPVIKHYKGVCHIYVDNTADWKKVAALLINAKVQRPSACNAMETLLLDKHLPKKKLIEIINSLLAQGVEIHGDETIASLNTQVISATPEDWDEEYLDLRLAVKTVDGIQGAIEHINLHGTGHTDAVLAQSVKVQKAFLADVDSSSLMINASTRFADGYEYGLGAEVGISTDKLHARGPMGVESLTTYQWIVTGKGHVRK